MDNVFKDNGDGTVTDVSTGLMWQQIASNKEMTWEQALAYCEGLNLGGHIDWRLPTIKELQSLVYDSYIEFPDMVPSFYWSSTPTVYSTTSAWILSFRYGGVGSGNKFNSYYVRAVRGGQV